MANIRVKCPACKSELEIDATFEGQEVECGNCLEVFKATRPGSGGSGGAGKIPAAGSRSPSASSSGRSRPSTPPKRRRRDDDDDYDHDRRRDDDDFDDYAPPPPRSSSGGSPGDGAAVASFVMGLFALLGCCCWPVAIPLGLAAAVSGGFGLKSRNNKGLAVAGLILGILSLFLSGGFIIGNIAPNQFR
jgi:predicted Zn finger-like uncharacterized protein